MPVYFNDLKKELEELTPAQLVRVAREDFGVEDFESYTIEQLVDVCISVEQENLFI
jgi:hypothetical protein